MESKKIVSLPLTPVAVATDSHQSEEGPHFIRNFIQRGDFMAFGVMKIDGEYEDNEQSSQLPAMLFKQPFCSSTKTMNYDDVFKYALVRKSLFEQMCVHVSKTDNSQSQSFQELLTKIKQREIDMSVAYISMTKKDLCYRLLTGICSDATLSLKTGNQHACINNRKVLLSLRSYETEQDTIENEKIREEHALLPQPQWEWGKGCFPISYYFHYSGMQLLADYYFETDEQGHAAVVKEFETLIAK